MRFFQIMIASATLASVSLGQSAKAAEICQGYGPQTPRDISETAGSNPRQFSFAPPATEMNLCNIHLHVNAEHKGPGFSVSAGSGEHGGFRCNETTSLTDAELSEPDGNDGGHGVKPGDTIEVHWVYTSCDVAPGEGLGACLSDQCTNPQLRVETQVFLAVNDQNALNYRDFMYDGNMANGLHQAKSLPGDTGNPVVFLGSTTGPSYDEMKCSPMQVTWSVRPACAKVDIGSLNAWLAGNVFNEEHAHGIRALVTAQELLAPIDR